MLNEKKYRINDVNKILLTMMIGLYFLIVGIDNILDYQTNFNFVVHVMKMDTINTGNVFKWRAVNSNILHHLSYWSIIATEILISVLSIFSVFIMIRQLIQKKQELNLAFSKIAVMLSIALFFFGFITIGGEWWYMWQSPIWNGIGPASKYIPFFIGVLIYFEK